MIDSPVRCVRCACSGAMWLLVLFMLCCCCVALAAQTPPAATTSEPGSDSAAIRVLADGFWADSAEVAHVPGLVLVVVKDGRVLFAAGYGFADLEAGTPMTVRTGVRAGSVSKSVTKVASWQLKHKAYASCEKAR